MPGEKRWEFSRDDFSPGAEKRHARAQESYRKAAKEWAEVGQLSLFPAVLGDGAPTVDERMALMEMGD